MYFPTSLFSKTNISLSEHLTLTFGLSWDSQVVSEVVTPRADICADKVLKVVVL